MITNLLGRKSSKQSPVPQPVETREVKIPSCYYVSTSVDGLIADAAGSVEWLKPFLDTDYGFHDFLDTIDTVVMGRRTYDRLLSVPRTNPYNGKRLVVLSHTRSSGPHADLFWQGHLRGLMLRLDALGSKSIWIVGGGSAAGAFLESGLLDEVQQFVMPLALGSGTPLFGPLRQSAPLHFKDSRRFENGALLLRYVP